MTIKNILQERIIQISSHLLIYLLMLSACSTKYETLVSKAGPPILTFKTDTLKIRERVTGVDFSDGDNDKLIFFTKPSKHLLHIQVFQKPDVVSLYYRGNRLSSNTPLPIIGDSTLLFCSADNPGTYTVKFILSDQLGKTTEGNIVILCSKNHKAKASLQVKFVDSSSTANWVYLLDGSGLYKPDGKINSYHFSIDGEIISANTNKIHWSFHSNGAKLIKHWLTDDLMENSDTVTQKIIIP